MKSLKSASVISVSAQDYAQYRYNAVFGRINYVFRDRYIINLTGRRDGSADLVQVINLQISAPLVLHGFFLKNNFLKDSHLSFLLEKIRASYGITGNDQLRDYEYLNAYTSSAGSYFGSVGLAPVRLSNPNFAWETNRKWKLVWRLVFLTTRFC